MGFVMIISMKLVYQFKEIFYNFLTTSNHLHPLQVENCDSNSRLVVDEDNNGKVGPERVKVGIDTCQVEPEIPLRWTSWPLPAADLSA